MLLLCHCHYHLRRHYAAITLPPPLLNIAHQYFHAIGLRLITSVIVNNTFHQLGISIGFINVTTLQCKSTTITNNNCMAIPNQRRHQQHHHRLNNNNTARTITITHHRSKFGTVNHRNNESSPPTTPTTNHHQQSTMSSTLLTIRVITTHRNTTTITNNVWIIPSIPSFNHQAFHYFNPQHIISHRNFNNIINIIIPHWPLILPFNIIAHCHYLRHLRPFHCLPHYWLSLLWLRCYCYYYFIATCRHFDASLSFIASLYHAAIINIYH